jgi:acetyl esterase/lipase
VRQSLVRRRVLVAVGAAVLAFGTPAVVSHVSLQPGAALAKVAFESGRAVTTAPGFEAVARTVTVDRNVLVPVAGEPDARLDVYRPADTGAVSLPMILWVHGGGYLSGSKDQVGGYLTMLAAKGYVVASLGYSLAPESTYPTPIRQGNTAIAYFRAHADTWGGDADRVFLGGDSAGAQIASQLDAVQTDPEFAATMHLTPSATSSSLRGTILFCGFYDMNTVGSSGFPALRTLLWSYTAHRDWLDDPDIDQLSTTSHITSRFPATFLTVGDADPFQPQAFELEKALHEHSVPVSSVFWNGSGDALRHEYQFDLTTPQARHAFQKTLAFLAARTEQ